MSATTPSTAKPTAGVRRWRPLRPRRGDCEDYAIAKYVALREAGVARENLQLVLVRDRAVRQDHAVLAGYPCLRPFPFVTDSFGAHARAATVFINGLDARHSENSEFVVLGY